MAELKILIVDDEPIAAIGLQEILEKMRDVNIVQTCNSGEDAIKLIRQQKLDLVLLDIEMPGISGFDVISKVGVSQMPCVVFVTAYDQFAIQAFEFHAFDYILKPVNPERLVETIGRVQKSIASQNHLQIQKQLDAIMNTVQTGGFASVVDHERMAIKSRGSIIFQPIADIHWIEAAGNYVQIHLEKSSYLSRTSLSNFETRLPKDFFLKIHRSTIVNTRKIAKLTPQPSGEIEILLDDNTTLSVSRTYAERLMMLVKKS